MNALRKLAAAGCLAGCLAAVGTVLPVNSGLTVSAETAVTESVSEVNSVEVQMDAEDLYDGTYNMLLIGSDRRNDGWYGNSDTMILVTINENTKTVYMVSFMRDTAAAIPGIGTRKLNAAYANGGATLLQETLENNFEVKIDNYAAVDFIGISSIIDALGGVDIEQSADEIKITNDYIHSLCEDWDLDPEEYYITEGTTHLNGLQALAYMRDRYVGNDYARTERQRTVLTALLGSLDISDVTSSFKLLKTLLTDVDTNIGVRRMMKLAGYLLDMDEYDLETDRIPYDDLHGSSGEMLVPSQPETNNRLLGKIYAKERAVETEEEMTE